MQKAPPRHPVVHHAIRLFLWPILRSYFRMRAVGRERVPRRGPFLLAANHVTMLDWAFVSLFLSRQVRFVVDRTYYDHPVLGIGLRIDGAVPVRLRPPDLQAIRTARAVLRAGDALAVFPEGRISLTGRPQRPQPGIIALASATRTPIVPVALRGAFDAFPRWSRFPRPGRVTVVFGRPLDPPPARLDREGQQAHAERLMGHIGALLDGVEQPETPW
jgi:1-acyl-sn-glycerol-3-phosphate acyltransferase